SALASQAHPERKTVLVDGSTRGQMGNAPKTLVFKEWKLEVHRVDPRRHEEHPLGDDADDDPTTQFPTPILLVPPLMVRPYVYDLRPDHSMVRYLRDRGFRVYVVDFGVPDAHDQGLLLDHYVFTFLPAAIDAVLRDARAEQVSMVGYCMGGIFAMLYAAAYHPSVSDGPSAGRTRNLVTIGAPINFEKLGIISLAARFGQGFVDQVMDRLGNVPSIGAELGFKIMGGTRTLTKWAGLAANLYDEEYVRGFDTINTWVNDLLPYPREAFKQMVRDVVGQNKLLKRELQLAGRPIDLTRIDAPLLALAGRNDNIATLESTRAVLDSVSSLDKTFVEVPGGHVGVIGGREARAQVWARTADWLAPRSVIPARA
ncbi:MAG: alpha/beta fold hydrolase, partial [Deltaproteobacteria bacterium]